MSWFVAVFALIALVLQSGCASTPGVNQQQIVANAGLQSLRLEGTNFSHQAFVQFDTTPSDRVHLYLSGDGLPWLRRSQISRNPTPRDPVALALMAQDPHAAIYLGRPCYHLERMPKNCQPGLWTFGRYSTEVVMSIAAALSTYLDEVGFEHVTAIGYSGGGVIALLLARNVPQIDRVITVAANLDTAAWSHDHGYAPLIGSLNPAQFRDWPVTLQEVHLQGAEDQRVSPATTQRFFAEATDRVVHRIIKPEYNHRCCWRKEWTSLLDEAQARFE